MPEFPLKGSQQTLLDSHDFMETEINITTDGSLTGKTKTWTYSDSPGFTGSVTLFLTDSTNTVLYATQPKTYKVHGQSYARQFSDEDPLVKSNRIDIWYEQITEDLLKHVTGYAIYHSYDYPQSIAYLITPFNQQGKQDSRCLHQEHVIKN